MSRIDIRSATRKALQKKKANQEVYSAVPFGYCQEGGKLIPLEEEQKIVSQIKQMRDAGNSFWSIARYLNAHGVAGKRGGKFHASTVRSILLNELHYAA